MISELSVAGPSVHTILARREFVFSLEDFEIIFIAVVYRYLLVRKSKR